MADAAAHTEGPFRIGGWTVEPDTHRLMREGRSVQLEPRVMAVLRVLAERRGEVVTREELLDRVWEGRFVTDHVLTQAISDLRSALGDEPAAPEVVETIRGRGYRLVAPVRRSPPEAEGPGAQGRPAAERKPPPAHSTAPRRARAWIPAAVAAVLLGVALVAFLAGPGSGGPPDAAVGRFVFVTSSHAEDRDPSLSPGGERIAWASGEGDELDLFVRSVSGGEALRLTTGGASERRPVWSPDGSRIAFLRFDGESGSIWTLPALGGEPLRVADYPYPFELGLAWSPDGRELALPCRLRGPEGPPAICRLSLEDLRLRAVTGAADAAGGRSADHSPVYSADGRRIAFLRSVGMGVEDLWVVDLDGGEERRITHDGRDLTGHAWYRDDRELLFSSNRAGIHSLWRVPAAGGEPRLMAGGGSKIKDPSTSRAGEAVAYEAWDLEINLWSRPLPAGSTGPGTAQPRAPSTGWDYQPSLSPDGTRLAFVSNRSGSAELWLDEPGREPRALTDLPEAAISDPAWSPSADRLVFALRREGPADLHVLDLGDLVPRRLTEHPGDEVAPSWSRDGRWIYFGSRRSGDWQVWRVPSRGGVAERVTRDGGFAAREAPDGALLFTRPQRPGIWRLQADGGARLVDGRLQAGDWRHWAPGAGGLYLLIRDAEGEASLWLRPAAGGEPRRLMPLPADTRGLAVAADASRVVYTRTDRSSSDVVLLLPAGVPG